MCSSSNSCRMTSQALSARRLRHTPPLGRASSSWSRDGPQPIGVLLAALKAFEAASQSARTAR